jgi:hypothetical protein
MKVSEMRDLLFNIENQDLTIRELRTILFDIDAQYEEVTAQKINENE